jgi:predicted nucleic-acid-binding protein
MIGIDTNVIVRFLAQDDDVQSPIATRFISSLSRERPGYISAVVLAEMTWVLSRAYKASHTDIVKAIEGLLRSTEIVVENTEAAWRALATYRVANSARFADALIAEIAFGAGARQSVTLDRKAVAEVGMRLLS